MLLLEMEYSKLFGQYHACWCTGSWSRHCTSRHGFGCVRQTICIVVPELISSIWVKQNPRYVIQNVNISSIIFKTTQHVNSLAPGKFEWNFREIIFKQILVIHGWGISCEIALIWMSLDFTDDQSTLVQVMVWCHQATSHYLSQCWPRSLTIWCH